MNAPAVAKPSPLARVKEQFDARQTEFSMALPQHMPVERFMRVVMTAVQRNPKLADADRVSLFNASLLAAQDGLLPDGRDGALVIYNTKVKGKDGERDQWVSAVQWMPMIAGILKKARNSGELSSIEAHLVHENDKFEFTIGTDDIPRHAPDWFGDRGKVIGVYAFAKLKDGARQCEVMSREQVEQVRAASKSKDSGPWVDWWGEMAKKTVLRRLLKRLPTSADLDDLIRRDDALYDFEGAREEAKRVQSRAPLADRLQALAAPQARPSTLEGRLEDVRDRHPSTESTAAASSPAVAATDPDANSGESPFTADASGSLSSDDDFPGDRPSREQMADDAYQAGQKARASGVKRRALPGDYRDDDELAQAWERGWDAGEGVAA